MKRKYTATIEIKSRPESNPEAEETCVLQKTFEAPSIWGLQLKLKEFVEWMED